MNAVEIEEAISNLAEEPFDADNFPYAFLEAFGNKATTIKKLKSGNSNSSDIQGGVLQRNNIHIGVCGEGEVTETLAALKASLATTKAKAKFILATDGIDLEAEDLTSGETVACSYQDFPDHFGFFLPLAGITTVKQIRENAFDIKATSRLNRLYIELIKDNPEWGSAERRHDMNHFMARLIFCFFAEDTDIFNGTGLFTNTIEQMSERDSSNTHKVMSEIFRSMDTAIPDRSSANLHRWADVFPYVNGGLFSGNTDVPRFSKIARSYLIHIGNLDWTKINPDIFGSMIQAVTDEEERGSLGLHYTSVPNILKVLNPLFLDDLRERLEEAGNNLRTLLYLRKRMAKIRVFDPACGSGNFLVIAYKEMRAIEAEINKRRGETDRKTDIPLTNFRGIELRGFPAEIARLALIIAEYQCDVMYLGQKEALAEFLPLDAMNWIVCGNALRMDWFSVCPPTGTNVKLHGDDLFSTPLDQSEIDFENEGGETYICGNPPYIGGKSQTPEQKADMQLVFEGFKNFKELDYIACWFVKAAKYINDSSKFAFVTTNSLCQGAQVGQLWPWIFENNLEIFFAFESFKWANNAKGNAGVSCSIIGIQCKNSGSKFIYSGEMKKEVNQINAYLTGSANSFINQSLKPISQFPAMITGNSPYENGNLTLTPDEKNSLLKSYPSAEPLLKKICGSNEFLKGIERWCLWIENGQLELANSIPPIKERIEKTQIFRENGGSVARGIANKPHQFRYTHSAKRISIIIPIVSSERRKYIPMGLLSNDKIIISSAAAIYDPEPYFFAIISSYIHMVWVKTTAGRLENRLRYLSALCYNTFPLPTLTTKNKEDLTRCTEDILLAREAHFPATIADLYDPENMPEDLRRAHDRNDEVLERIYIGRRFKNDTERLEKLFELYTKMTQGGGAAKVKTREAG